MNIMTIFNFNIFLAAFLLFQIELIMGKMFLPQYGGSYLVWGACVVFFQAALVVGYTFAHLIVSRFGIGRYLIIHLCLLYLPLVCFPGRPLPAIFPHFQVPLVIDIFFQLMGTIGLVFFVLTTISIISQSWLASSSLPERSNPYQLYSISNLGSFGAILSYPLFFEVFFDLDTQLMIWRIGYWIVVGLTTVSFWRIKVKKEARTQDDFTKASPHQLIRWFLLGTAGVVLFLSVTNIITSEIAPIPLLWIIPLSIYLLSFVLNFKRNPWCPNWIRENVHVTIGFSIILYFLMLKKIMPFFITLGLFNFSLFIICMFCQNELQRYKPADERKLTIFYVITSLGGFFGGILVSWIMPLIFTSHLEYFIGFFILSMAFVIGQERTSIGFYNIRLIIYLVIFLTLWAIKFQNYHIFGIIFILFIFKRVFQEFKTKPRVFSLALIMILFLTPLIEIICTKHFYIFQQRNFYGMYKIYDVGPLRYFIHGSTIQGAQYLPESREMEPLTYYSRSTPVGELLDSNLFDFHHIGIIGLGTGTLAAYNNPRRAMDFFELDPDVMGIMSQFFSYLWKSSGQVNYILGDARLSMDKIPHNRYDLIIVDAFSGDSIPFHLLTTEAIATYLIHLKDNGLILFHTSNRYLNLPPVLHANASYLGAYSCVKSNREANGVTYASDWVALTWDQASYLKLVTGLKWSYTHLTGMQQEFRPWSDQYSNVLSVLKVGSLVDSVKNFKVLYW